MFKLKRNSSRLSLSNSKSFSSDKSEDLEKSRSQSETQEPIKVSYLDEALHQISPLKIEPWLNHLLDKEYREIVTEISKTVLSNDIALMCSPVELTGFRHLFNNVLERCNGISVHHSAICIETLTLRSVLTYMVMSYPTTISYLAAITDSVDTIDMDFKIASVDPFDVAVDTGMITVRCIPANNYSRFLFSECFQKLETQTPRSISIPLGKLGLVPRSVDVSSLETIFKMRLGFGKMTDSLITNNNYMPTHKVHGEFLNPLFEVDEDKGS